MAIETLYADAHLAGSISNPANAVGSTTGTWAGDVNVATTATSRWSIANPAGGSLAAGATHTVNVVCRKGSNSGNPTVELNLYVNGSLVKQLAAATSVTSTTGQTVSGTFTTAEAADSGTGLEVEVVVTAAGGGPSARNSAQVDTIAVAADISAFFSTTVPVGPAFATAAGFGAPTVVQGHDESLAVGTVATSASVQGAVLSAGSRVSPVTAAGSAGFSGPGLSTGSRVEPVTRATAAAFPAPTTVISVVAAAHATSSAFGEVVFVSGNVGTPTGLQAVAVSATQVDLSWDAASGAVRYDIERNGQVLVLDVVGTSYSDTTVVAETAYTYRVRAVA